MTNPTTKLPATLSRENDVARHFAAYLAELARGEDYSKAITEEEEKAGIEEYLRLLVTPGWLLSQTELKGKLLGFLHHYGYCR